MTIAEALSAWADEVGVDLIEEAGGIDFAGWLTRKGYRIVKARTIRTKLIGLSGEILWSEAVEIAEELS